MGTTEGQTESTYSTSSSQFSTTTYPESTTASTESLSKPCNTTDLETSYSTTENSTAYNTTVNGNTKHADDSMIIIVTGTVVGSAVVVISVIVLTIVLFNFIKRRTKKKPDKTIPPEQVYVNQGIVAHSTGDLSKSGFPRNLSWKSLEAGNLDTGVYSLVKFDNTGSVSDTKCDSKQKGKSRETKALNQNYFVLEKEYVEDERGKDKYIDTIEDSKQKLDMKESNDIYCLAANVDAEEENINDVLNQDSSVLDGQESSENNYFILEKVYANGGEIENEQMNSGSDKNTKCSRLNTDNDYSIRRGTWPSEKVKYCRKDSQKKDRRQTDIYENCQLGSDDSGFDDVYNKLGEYSRKNSESTENYDTMENILSEMNETDTDNMYYNDEDNYDVLNDNSRAPEVIGNVYSTAGSVKLKRKF